MERKKSNSYPRIKNKYMHINIDKKMIDIDIDINKSLTILFSYLKNVSIGLPWWRSG